ncbi:MAG: 4Fe-4S dicluster domain-containing protein [Myxococcota bacterium]
MAKVFNWQLGRKMDYPYGDARPKRQIAWIFDLNKCIACQTCSIACKMTWSSGRGQEYMFWNNVETKPYGGYPKAWDLAVLQMIGPGEWRNGSYHGKTIFEAANQTTEKMVGYRPGDEDWNHPNIGEDVIAGGEMPQGAHIDDPTHPLWFFYMPRICNHCTHPACLAACPRKAIYKREEDGIVLIDQSRCRGYRECVKGCPYGKSLFRANHEVSEKCIGCYPKIEKGRQTQCVENCIGKIRGQGFVTDPRKGKPNPNNPIDYLVHIRKMALPLYPQFGTGPNVYYIPPIHASTDFLEQMFGDGVQHAIDAYRDIPNDETLAGLLQLFGSSPEIMETFKVKKQVATGYNRDGKQVAEVPITEPPTTRAGYDKKRNVYRLDVT